MERIYRAQDIMYLRGGQTSIEYDERRGVLEARVLGVMLTYRCTLRCRLCSTRVPYYKNPPHPSLEELKEDFRRWFSIADYTIKLELQGGEPLVRDDFAEYMEFLLQYRKQFGRVRFITNGTLPVSDELMDVLKKYGDQLDVIIDHYGDLSKYAEKIAAAFEKNHIQHYVRPQDKEHMYLNGWYDYGDIREEIHSVEEAKELFKKCVVSNNRSVWCYMMDRGKVYPCITAMHRLDFGIMPDSPDEYLDLYDEGTDIRRKKERLFSFSQRDYFTYCRHCNGIHEDSPRIIPAEQLPLEATGCEPVCH